MEVANPLVTAFRTEEKHFLQECIHCGFCLQVCPTYVTNGKEMDSPRGRIYLMEAARTGRVDLSKTFIRHMDLCLVCLACETACPSGVQFGHLMERTRETILPYSPKSKISRWLSSFLLRRVIPSHQALSIIFRLTWFYQRSGLHWILTHKPLKYLLSKRIRLLQQSLPRVPANRFGGKERTFYDSMNGNRGKVALFTGCIMDHLYPDVHQATVRVLTWNGYDVVIPEGQTCCGALHAHTGDKEMVHNLASSNLSALLIEEVDAIIVNAAGCGAQLKNYGKILEGSDSTKLAGRMRDFTEFMFGQDVRIPDQPLNMKVVYDEPCHLIHGQGISAEPNKIIQSIPGVKLLPLTEADRCCGSAGSYTIIETQMSIKLLDRKMSFIKKSGADAIVTANPGCQVQLEWGVRKHHLPIEVLTIAELLDRAYQTDPRYMGLKNR